MNLEQLTKHQIVLLTLLVSFVTSIATGIVTVSLMGQAPEGVTRVVNQIVEHTVEKVVPSATQGAAVATTEKTVVIKDDDLAAQSIAVVQKSIVRIVQRGGNELVSRGVIIDAQGTALADKAALRLAGNRNFEAILPSGERAVAVIRSSDNGSPLAVLDIAVGTSTVAPAKLAAPETLALGQSVIRVGGAGADRVATGVVAALPAGEGVRSVEASVSSATPGSLLMTLFGEIIGLTTSDSAQAGGTLYAIPVLPAAN